MSTKKSVPDFSFERIFWMVAAVLAAVCLVFLVLNLVQGPRLRRVTVDRAEVVRQPDQRLVMYVNQPLGAVNDSQITISPKAAFTAAVNGETLSMQFNERLLYNTNYTITVQNVAARYRKHTVTTFHYSFKTADPTIFFIRRHAEANLDGGLLPSKKADEIIQSTLSGSKETTVFNADKIQDYVLLGDSLLVTTISGDTFEDTTNNLYLVNIKTKQVEELSLPGKGTVTDLRASPNQRLAGYSFTSSGKYNERKYQNIVFNIDMAASRLQYPVDGLDGKPLQVMDWQFAPDGTTIIAQTYDTNLLLVDTNLDNKPLPLGQFTGMENFSYNGAKLIADDRINGPLVLDLLAHTRTPLTNGPTDSNQPYLQSARLLSNGDGLIKQMMLYKDDTTYSYTQSLTVSKGNSEKTVYKNSDQHTQLGLFDSSPNDQYLVAEVYTTGEDSMGNDEYPETPQQIGTKTLIINVSDGKTSRTIDGFKVTWE